MISRWIFFFAIVSLQQPATKEVQLITSGKILQTPTVGLSALQVAHGVSIEVKVSGFGPDRQVTSHLRKPNNTEHPVLNLRTNGRGELSHTIETLLLVNGTYEIWVVDEATGAATNSVRFAVGIDAASGLSPEAARVWERYGGVWNSASTLVALTAKSGGTAGTIAYPVQTCGGVLALRSVSADAVEFAETLSYGTERCPTGRTVTLRLQADGKLAIESRGPSGAGVRTDTLNFLKD